MGLTSTQLPGSKLLEASPDCVKIIDTLGRLQFMNRNGRCLMEIDDIGSIRGEVWSMLWPQVSRALVEKALADALDGRETRFTAECPTAKGHNKHWDVAVAPIADESGGVAAILSVSRDITAQRGVEANLRQSEQHFRALANNMAQLAWMADPTGHVFWYNQRWYDFTGTAFEEMAGWGWQRVLHPDHVERVVEKFSASFESGNEWEDVFPIRGADG
ncbi:MAG: PAS domain-containing protein, partial [Hyphomicrobiaceae bacterium]|nr:PAS domain-containing protein [Hyphomicrobiaceae bacterium]